MKKIKILYITYNLGLGGQEKQLLELVNNLDLSAFEPKILPITTNLERMPYIKNDFLFYNKMENKNKFGRLIRIIKTIKEFKPDIIHSFDATSNIYSGISLKFFRIPLIGGFNGSYIKSKITKLLNRIFSTNFEKIICNSYAGFNYLKNDCKIQEEKLKVIENGFDFKIMENPPFKISNLEEILGKEIKNPIVGSVGKLDENKDPLTFIKAAEIVHKEFPQTIFCIIGNGEYKGIVENYLREKKMENYFYLIPKRIDAPWIIKDFTIGVLSSKFEGFPNVLLEYMYWRKPIVTTKAGDCERIVIDKDSGFVVERGNFLDFANAIIFLLASKEKQEFMGKRGREILEEKYGIERYAKDFADLYLDIIGT